MRHGNLYSTDGEVTTRRTILGGCWPLAHQARRCAGLPAPEPSLLVRWPADAEAPGHCSHRRAVALAPALQRSQMCTIVARQFQCAAPAMAE